MDPARIEELLGAFAKVCEQPDDQEVARAADALLSTLDAEGQRAPAPVT